MSNFEVIETKIDALEKRTERHGDRINHLETNFNKLQEILDGIQKTLQQIKWVAMGGGYVYSAGDRYSGVAERVAVIC